MAREVLQHELAVGVASQSVHRRAAFKDTTQEGEQNNAEVGDEEKVKGKACGGPHRAFHSEFIAKANRDGTYPDQKTKFVEANKAYKALKAAGGPEWARILRPGRLGTASAKAGGQAFGGSVRKQVTSESEADLNGLFNPPADSVAGEPSGLHLAVPVVEEKLAVVLSRVDAQCRQQNKVEKAAKDKEDQ
jgi:hypothetical protein